MKAFAAITAFIIALGIVFGIEAGIAEILHLIFPAVLSFWRWFGLVFLANLFLTPLASRSKS